MTYRLSDVYTAIADANRRAILDLVSTRSMNISEIAEHFEMSRVAVDKHLNVLIDTKLLVVEKDGRNRVHHLNPAPMQVVWDWMGPYSHFWSDRLQQLKATVEEANS